MTAVHEVQLPSGLTIKIREFKTRDEDLISKKKTRRKGGVGSILLTAVTESVSDPGPYELLGGKVDWKKVLQGDIQTALKENRVETWGPEFTYGCPCPHCKEPVKTDVDLDEIPVKKLPESSLKHVMDGEPLQCVLPKSGKVAKFRLLRGRDEKALEKIEREHDDTKSTSYLRLRTIEVEGVPEPDLFEWLKDASAGDSAYLRAAFDEADCGLNQEIEMACQSCYHVWADDVRFTRDFLFPKFRGRIKKKR
jgi:hypothetical protein